jgi:hypothetical protein
MRKDMWDLDVTGMKSKQRFIHVGTFDTVAEAECISSKKLKAISMSL